MATAPRRPLGIEVICTRLPTRATSAAREILACHEAGITTTVPVPATSGNEAKGMYVKADFVYESTEDVYRCPAGEDATDRYTTIENGLQIRRILDQRMPELPAQSAMHDRRVAAHHPLGT